MGGNTTKTSNKIDPQLMALYNANYNRASNLANQPAPVYSGQFTAPLNSTETQAGGLYSNIAANNPGSSTINSGISGASGVLGYNPSSVTAGQLSTTNLAPYMNPFTNDVISTSLAQLNQQRGQQRVADNQAATAAGAFGGNRQGVADALTNQLYDQNAGSLIAGLNAQNFGQAQNAAQSDITNRLNANEFNTNAGLTANGQRLSASGLLGDLGNSQFNNANTAAGNLMNYGILGQQTTNSADLAKYADFLRMVQDPLQKQALLNSSLGMIPTQGTTTQSQNQGFGGILGDLGSIAFLASALI
jgi:hypothetical protein